MSATDELRRLLDERGARWTACSKATIDNQTFCYGHTLTEFQGGLMVTDLTPEQAIEATLGSGTCRNLITRVKGQMPMLHCEECGCTTTLNVPSGGAGYAGETEMRWPRFCSNCGRKVVGE